MRLLCQRSIDSPPWKVGQENAGCFSETQEYASLSSVENGGSLGAHEYGYRKDAEVVLVFQPSNSPPP